MIFPRISRFTRKFGEFFFYFHCGVFAEFLEVIQSAVELSIVQSAGKHSLLMRDIIRQPLHLLSLLRLFLCLFQLSLEVSDPLLFRAKRLLVLSNLILNIVISGRVVCPELAHVLFH